MEKNTKSLIDGPSEKQILSNPSSAILDQSKFVSRIKHMPVSSWGLPALLVLFQFSQGSLRRTSVLWRCRGSSGCLSMQATPKRETHSDVNEIIDSWNRHKQGRPTIEWTVMQCCADIHGPQMINRDDFGDPLTFPWAQSWGWHFSLFKSNVLKAIERTEFPQTFMFRRGFQYKKF